MTSTCLRLLPVFFLCLAWQSHAMGQTRQDQTVASAIKVLDEIMAVPAKQIPQSLLSNAAGVAIFPNVVKGGFVVGVRHGRGVVLVRDDKGQWHPPLFASLSGGSVGWQAGLQSTDVVLVFKTRRSVNQLLTQRGGDGLINGKFTLGVDAAAAAGPVGRQASVATDARLVPEILSYSRSRGLFAGVSIDGSVLQLEHLYGSGYYGRPTIAANGESVVPWDTLPASAIRLINRLAHYTGSPEIVTAASAGNPLANVATSTTSQTENLRRQLASSWQSLALRLDNQWRAYLEPPRELLVPGQIPHREILQGKLKHYQTIYADPNYAVLNKAPEFVATYKLLQDYVNSLPPTARPKLQLPPPPAINTGRPNPRY